MKQNSCRWLAVIMIGSLAVASTTAQAGQSSHDALAKGHIGAKESFITQGLWAKSNGYGHAQAFREISASGASVNHVIFTSFDGRTVAVINSGSMARVVYPTGELETRVLPNKSVLVHVYVTAGACSKDTTSHAVEEASVLLDSNGQPLSQRKAARAEELQRQLWCQTSDLRSEMRAFATTAGIDINSPLQKYENGASQIRPLDSIDCGLGIAGTGVAFAAWAAEPIDPLAYWGFALAYTATARACGWT